MSSFLQNLENNEAILLMYLANELPAEDRAEVEEMLQHDANLLAQLNELRDAYHCFDQTMLLGDASNVLPSGYTAAHAFGKMVQARYTVRPKPNEEQELPSRRQHWIIYYPAAAVLLLAVGMAIWWKSATEEMKRSASPMIVERDGFEGRRFGNDRFGGGFPGAFGGFGAPLPPLRFGSFRGPFAMWGQPMIDFSQIVAGNPSDLSDEVIEASFDPIVVLPRLNLSQRELVVLDYLDQSWQ